MLRTVVIVGCLGVFLACKGGEAASPTPPPSEASPVQAPLAAEKTAVPAEAPAAATATERVEDPSFELALQPSGDYAVGQLGSLAVSLKPRGQYHINQDYPITVTLKPPAGLRLPKVEYKKADAAVFGEQLARFDVPLTPEQAGAHRMEANVRFAVCTPENCVPDERTLALNVAVK